MREKGERERKASRHPPLSFFFTFQFWQDVTQPHLLAVCTIWLMECLLVAQRGAIDEDNDKDKGFKEQPEEC